MTPAPTAARTARRAARTLALVAAGALLAGCAAAGGPPPAAGGTRLPGPGAVDAAGAVPTAPAGADADADDQVGATARPQRPGELADRDVPDADRTVQLDVAFGGLVLGPGAPGTERVVYPWLHATGDGAGTTYVHLKLPVFTCPSGSGQGSRTPARGCTDRTVSYADSDASGAVVVVDAASHVHVVVRAPSYAYGAGVDRGPREALSPSAPEVGLVVDADPGAVLRTEGGRRTWRPVATARLTGAWARGSAATARADDGYDNLLSLGRR